MARALYQKPRLLPDAQSFFEELTDLRALVAELVARYSTLEPTTSAAEAATIRCPRDVARLIAPRFTGLDHEELHVLLLNSKNRVLDVLLLYRGTLNSASSRVAELFKPAILASAASIVIVHNHPSGDPTPSPEDAHLTGEAVKAGRLLDIEVLDHVIVCTTDQYVSLKERGLGFS